MKKGRKSDYGKPRWDLLPWSQAEEVVKVLTFGASKYKPNNWRHIKDGERRYFAAALRHLAASANGEDLDSETGFPHYSHAICSLFFAAWHRKRYGKVKKTFVF